MLCATAFTSFSLSLHFLFFLPSFLPSFFFIFLHSRFHRSGTGYDYSNNMQCEWKISGVDYINVVFMNVETCQNEPCDIVEIFDGPDQSYPSIYNSQDCNSCTAYLLTPTSQVTLPSSLLLCLLYCTVRRVASLCQPFKGPLYLFIHSQCMLHSSPLLFHQSCLWRPLGFVKS